MWHLPVLGTSQGTDTLNKDTREEEGATDCVCGVDAAGIKIFVDMPSGGITMYSSPVTRFDTPAPREKEIT